MAAGSTSATAEEAEREAEREAEWEAAWKAAEERARLETQAREVNEGELAFLPQEPAANSARMEKHLELKWESLDDGWARMHQCHHNLDPAAAVQIVYNDERTRDIRITRRDGVGRAEVDGPSVQMRDIERGASLCVAAQVLAILPHPDKAGYVVDNGPFMRRFLDGYYPMHVRLAVSWPEGMLAFEESSPPAQPGLAIESDDQGVTLEAYFEGRLESRLHLVRGAAAP
ncbi:alpha/beta hydrolase [Guyparkeria halophila]|uniref:Alpha/beta hydrolase n=1 Tax=Guyparkeria halophila TaxID=47960 RepID=A0ABZ0YVR3_9GAMM|nr:alpha/beta hydrolase [Guyparkeria halophila]WQH15275.1 alpha/beta hydrolase [Guyparkeria halophila]